MYSTYLRLGLHVSASDREVIKATQKKFNKEARRDPVLRRARHDVYRVMLEYHHNSQELFGFVLVGSR
jgi:hypothetical protein